MLCGIALLFFTRQFLTNYPSAHLIQIPLIYLHKLNVILLFVYLLPCRLDELSEVVTALLESTAQAKFIVRRVHRIRHASQ